MKEIEKWQNKNYLITNEPKYVKSKQKFVIISKKKNKMPFLSDKRLISKEFITIEYALGYLFGLKKIKKI
jgi:hypothetical protein